MPREYNRLIEQLAEAEGHEISANLEYEIETGIRWLNKTTWPLGHQLQSQALSVGG